MALRRNAYAVAPEPPRVQKLRETGFFSAHPAL